MGIITLSFGLLGVTIVGYEENFLCLAITAVRHITSDKHYLCPFLVWSFPNCQKNIFVYIFVCAFFPGALRVSLKMIAMAGYFELDTDLGWDVIFPTLRVC